MVRTNKPNTGGMLVGLQFRKEATMLKFVLTAAVIAGAAAAPAFADTAVAETALADTGSQPRTFTRNGETFSYTQVAKGDQVAIDGRNLTSGSTFHLVVRGKRVSGVSSGVPVSFAVPAKTTGMTDAVIAAR
jgi:hypothetical protein